MKHRLLATLALPIAALALGACATTQSTVLDVNGVKVSRSSLDTELKGFAENQLAQKKTAAEKTKMEGRLYGKTKAATKSFNADFVAFILNTRLVNEVVHSEAVARKVTLAPLDATARTSLVGDYGGEALFKKLPKDYQARAERSAKEFASILEAEKKKLPSPAAYFEQNKASFPGETCVSHILVKTLDEAKAARSRVVAGEDFATVAKAVSQDPGSKDAGGSLSCGNPSQFVAEFASAATTLKVNELSEPVQTQFGFHVIKVTKRTASSLAAAKVSIESALSKQAQSASSASLVTRLKKLKVSVDPTVGTYVVKGSNGFPEIVSTTAAKTAKAAAEAADAAAIPTANDPSGAPTAAAGG